MNNNSMYCMLTKQRYHETAIIDTNGAVITWNNFQLHSPSDFQCEFDILQIKYCSYKFKELHMFTRTKINLNVNHILLNSFTTHKHQFYSENVDDCWCISFKRRKNESSLKNEYVMGLQVLSMPPLIGYIEADIFVKCEIAEMNKISQQHTFSFENENCVLCAFMPIWFSSNTQIQINIAIKNLYDIKFNVISRSKWAKYGVSDGKKVKKMNTGRHRSSTVPVKMNLNSPINFDNFIPRSSTKINNYSMSMSNLLPINEDDDDDDADMVSKKGKKLKDSTKIYLEPETMSGEFEIEFTNKQLGKFINAKVSQLYEYNSVITCAASIFDLVLYPNGIASKTAGYIQFGIKCNKQNFGLKCKYRLNETVKNADCFMIHYKLSCQEMNIIFEEMTNVSSKEILLKWPADALPLEECKHLSALHFKTEVKILKMIKHRTDNNEHTCSTFYYYKPIKHKWNVNDDDIFSAITTAKCGQCFYSNIFNDCWCLRVAPNGICKKDEGKLRITLLLLGYPEKVCSVGCHIRLSIHYTLENYERLLVFEGVHNFKDGDKLNGFSNDLKGKQRTLKMAWLKQGYIDNLEFSVECTVNSLSKKKKNVTKDKWHNYGLNVIDEAEFDQKEHLLKNLSRSFNISRSSFLLNMPQVIEPRRSMIDVIDEIPNEFKEISWNITGDELKRFRQCCKADNLLAQLHSTKYFDDWQIGEDFGIQIYPNGYSKIGYVQLLIVVKLLDSIDGFMCYIEACCKQTSTYYKGIKIINRGEGIEQYKVFDANTLNNGLKALDFVVRVKVLNIRYKSHSKYKNFSKDIRIDRFAKYEWNMDRGTLLQFEKSKVGDRYYTDVLANCWRLVVLPKGLDDDGVEKYGKRNFVLGLKMVWIPANVKAIKVAVSFKTNFASKKSEKWKLFSYNDTFLSIWKQNGAKKDWLLLYDDGILSFDVSIKINQVINYDGNVVNKYEWHIYGINA